MCHSFSSAFKWVDGSSQGDGHPSSQSELEQSGYSHWGGNSSSHEPSTLYNCVRASLAYPRFWFYTGNTSNAARRAPANYFSSSFQDNNLLAWDTIGCEWLFSDCCQHVLVLTT